LQAEDRNIHVALFDTEFEAKIEAQNIVATLQWLEH